MNDDKEAIQKLNDISDKRLIVGIGGSAGSSEAIEELFSNISLKQNISYLILQHKMSSSQPVLPALLKDITGLPIRMIQDSMEILPKHIYISPPGKNISILDDKLYLFDINVSETSGFPIDEMFRSIAYNYKTFSAGILLSGTGKDGVSGLTAIKESGGKIIVQDPASALFLDMPKNAINKLKVDLIASPHKIGRFISELDINHISDISSHKYDNESINKVLLLLRSHTGFDFSHYKKHTINRRVLRRMEVLNISHIKDFIILLQKNPEELEILYKELFISSTEFFRDKKIWDYLKNNILSNMISGKSDGESLRIWVPGCATGEEAYSLIMVLDEIICRYKKKKIDLKIFATDINSDAVKKARFAIYDKRELKGIPKDYIENYFIEKNNRFQIIENLRKRMIFAKHIVHIDPPFRNIDLISCRNLLIYMDAELQELILSIFHYSLKDNGILLLGRSETTGEETEAWMEIDQEFRVYKKSCSEINKKNILSILSSGMTNSPLEPVFDPNYSTIIRENTERLLLKDFIPSGIITNKYGDILHIFGKTSKYLEPVCHGKQMNVFSMAKSGLKSYLSQGIRSARDNYEKIILKNIIIKEENKNLNFDITIKKIREPDVLRDKFIILFTSYSEEESSEDSSPEIKASGFFKMEDELQNLKLKMKSTIEDMQISREELFSVNEELQACNDDLRVSREEMQTLCEELYSSNEDLQRQLNLFEEMYYDIRDILDMINIPIIILDSDLRIKRFTKEAGRIFNLLKGDINRKIIELSLFAYDKILAETALEVIKTGEMIQKNIMINEGRNYNAGFIPYKKEDLSETEVIIVFRERDKKMIIYYKGLYEALRASNLHFYFFDRELRYKWIQNPHPGFQEKEMLGKRDDELFDRSFSADIIKEKQKAIQNGIDIHKVLMMPTPKGIHSFYIFIRPVYDDTGDINGGHMISIDFSEQSANLEKKETDV